MNILILGGGGREHSLAWAVLQNPKCDRLVVAPGNAGIAAIADCAALDISDGGTVANFVEEEAIDFVIIGPEAPLAAGLRIVCAMQGCWCSDPAKPPRNSKRPKHSPNKSAMRRARQRPPMGISPMRTPPRPMSPPKGRPSCQSRRVGRRQGRDHCRNSAAGP